MSASAASPAGDWISRWQRVARRIRVPLGFLTAVLYLFELWHRAPQTAAIAWSLALVIPGLWLRGYASGYVKKNQELTTTGPYGGLARDRIPGDLCPGDCFGGALPGSYVSRIRGLLPKSPANFSPLWTSASAERE